MTFRSAESRFECFAQTAPDLEPISARELKARGRKPRKEIGGVSFRGDLRALYDANLWLRSASRVVVRMGRFHATAFHELERRAKNLSWEEYLPSAGRVVVRVTARKSKLYHSDAIAERVLGAIAKVSSSSVQVKVEDDELDADNESAEDESEKQPAQLFIVRVVHDEFEISADSSGELLHRRGYRREIAKAPLRETLAAAMVLASGWKGDEPLIDPLCGSGTIPIEAAMIANEIAPGLRRRFAFMEWPGFDKSGWEDAVEDATKKAAAARKKRLTGAGQLIIGCDRDSGAVAIAARNAERAGVEDLLTWREAALSNSIASIADYPAGWVITNPPYGVRVGDTRELRNLYATLGRVSGDHPGWRTGVLTADKSLAAAMGTPLRERFATRNGGIPVSFFVNANSRATGSE